MKTIMLNNSRFEWEEDMSISNIMKKKNFTFKMLVVKLNGKLVRKENYATTIVPENADVKIIHLISGG